MNSGHIYKKIWTTFNLITRGTLHTVNPNKTFISGSDFT